MQMSQGIPIEDAPDQEEILYQQRRSARELLEFERQEANRGYVAAEDAFWLVEEDYKDEAFAWARRLARGVG